MANVVTPQMYGAVADGIADDTDAFQAAVDSGYDVFVPTACRETYRITRTIKVIRKNCNRIFSEPFFGRTGRFGCVIADFRRAEDPRNTALFDIQVCGITIGGLRFVSENEGNSRLGLFASAMNEALCDYDIKIDRCAIKSFYRVCNFTGRGLEILNSQIASCNYIANLYWDDVFDTNENHPAEYDQRAICVKNCRLHSITSGFINVRSGHAYGLHFEGNTVDNGKGYILRAYDQAWGWNVSGNVIQGICGDFDALDFRKGMQNCNINGNTFLADKGYWIGSEGTVRSWMKCGGTVLGSIISNNVFKNTDGNFLSFKDVECSALNGNVFHSITQSGGGAIVISGANKKNAITGNAA